jgi:hypothetical protein
MYEKQYIAFSRQDPEKPELFSDSDELRKLIKEEVLEAGNRDYFRNYTKIVEIEIEEFASVSGSWRDVTEEMYSDIEVSMFDQIEDDKRGSYHDNRRGY